MLPRITAILYNKKLSRKHDVSKNHRSESNLANKHQSNTPKKEKQQEKNNASSKDQTDRQRPRHRDTPENNVQKHKKYWNDVSLREK